MRRTPCDGSETVHGHVVQDELLKLKKSDQLIKGRSPMEVSLIVIINQVSSFTVCEFGKN
jgi:hypothetical protein